MRKAQVQTTPQGFSEKEAYTPSQRILLEQVRKFYYVDARQKYISMPVSHIEKTPRHIKRAVDRLVKHYKFSKQSCID